MSGFTIDIRDPNDVEIRLPSRVAYTPVNWSSVAVGGCELASVLADGHPDGVWQAAKWLGHKIRIWNHLGDLVWWGHIHEVNITQGSFSIGISLDSMNNRIRVAYTYEQADGVSIRGDTDWSQNDDSVARYGTKELQHSGGADLLDTAADEMRDSLLDQLKYPIPTIAAGEVDTRASATIDCRGDFELLDWQYYTELRGLEESKTSGSAVIPIGYGFTTALTWFGDDEKEIHANEQYLDGIEKEMVLDISGGANAGTYTADSPPRGEIESVTQAATFIIPDNIIDSEEVIGQWSTGDVIKITGTTNNNGYYYIRKVEEIDKIDVELPSIQNETPTAATFTRGYSFKVLEAIGTTPLIGVSSTVTPRGHIAAQSFTPEHNVATWTCNTISVRLKKIGSPADNVKLELRSGGAVFPSATVLASDTVAAADIFDTNPGWYEFDMGNTINITYGTTYWIVISRTGALDGQNYYELSIDEDVPYTLGILKLYSTDTTWYARTTDATMPFIVKGKEPITDQITNIITNYAQFINGVDILDASTIQTNQYRPGDTTSLVELKNFLEMGVNSGRRYICHTTPERYLIVYQEPQNPATAGTYPQLAIAEDGRIRLTRGGIYPAGRLPAGKWIDVRTTHLAGDSIAALSPYFVERAEYDAESNQTRLEPRNNDPFNIGIKQG